MTRNLLSVGLLVVFTAGMLWPTAAMAGGPPLLCLPLEGVSARTAPACAKLLTDKLGDKVVEHPNWPREVKVLERGGQWYLAFYMSGDVRLADVTSALKGSGAAVALDRLRMFGHVILEIDAPAKSRSALVADLKAVPHVSVGESKAVKDTLLVTLDMPYPVEPGQGRADLDSIGWTSFARNDFASDGSARSEPPVSAEQLPSYRAIGEAVTRHGGGIKDVRWSANHACRTLGGVAAAR